MKKCLLFILLTYSLSIPLLGQKDNIRFENLTIDNGLSQNSVITICQDRQGFLWFGTYDGLNRYDGYKFKIFKNNPLDSTSLSQNLVWDICEDHLGNLWIATDGGLNKFNKETETFTQYIHKPKDPASISNNRIRDIFEDKEGILWIATENGLNSYDRNSNSFHKYLCDPKKCNTLSNNLVRFITEDHLGNLWVGTDYGLNIFDKKTKSFKRIFNDPKDSKSLSDNTIYSIAEDSFGIIWIGTRSEGLNRYERNTGKFIRYSINPNNPFAISNNYIRGILSDRTGNLWIGTYGGGLEKYDRKNDSFIHYQNTSSNAYSISSNAIYCIYEDYSGIIWVGTDFSGVNKFDKWKNQFAYYSNQTNDSNSINNNNVNCFCEDLDDKYKSIWIGTWKGINLFNRITNKFTFFTNNPADKFSLSNNVVRTIAIDKNGIIWVGTDNGLNKFDRKQNKFFRYYHDPQNPYSISHNLIRDIIVDRNNNVYIATNGNGFCKYDRAKDRFINYDYKSADLSQGDSKIVWALLEDHMGNIWLGTDASGLVMFDPKTELFTVYSHNPKDSTSINTNKVLTIQQTRDKTIWIGTAGGGLNKFNPLTRKFSAIQEKDGLCSNTIHSILEDKNGSLWVSSIQGLSKIDLKNNKISNYNVLDGLQSNEFHVNSYCICSTGEMLFGGIKGFNMFRPEEIVENKFIPQIVITDFQLFNKSLPIGKNVDGRILLEKSISQSKEITLSYLDEVFTVEFSALDFAAPEKNKYKYILEGYDKEWNEVDNRRYATYTKVPPGKYKLKIIGSNHSNLWNYNPVTLSIIILPPFWQTWWFRTILLIAFVTVIITGYNFRINRIIKQNKELETRVKERTKQLEEANNELEAFSYSISHDLRTPLRAIDGYCKIFLEEYEDKVDNEGKRLLNVIANNSNKMGLLINDLLQFSRASRVEIKKQLVDLNKIIEPIVIELMQSFNRNINEIEIQTLPNTFCDPALMRQVWVNLISNAIKFTSKVANPKIVIGFYENKEEYIYFIKDNGAGFNQEYSAKLFGVFQRLHKESEFEGTGAGLAIVKRIINRHNGRIWATGELSKGATFYFTLQKNN